MFRLGTIPGAHRYAMVRWNTLSPITNINQLSRVDRIWENNLKLLHVFGLLHILSTLGWLHNVTYIIYMIVYIIHIYIYYILPTHRTI